MFILHIISIVIVSILADLICEKSNESPLMNFYWGGYDSSPINFFLWILEDLIIY